MDNKFFRFTKETAKTLREANLTKNARILWDYLVTKAPYGDREEYLEYTEILNELGWEKHTYYRAKSELDKKGLIIFGNSKCTFISTLKTKITETVETVTKTVKELQNLSQSNKNCKSSDKICQNQSLEPLSNIEPSIPQTIQTNSDLSDPSEEMKDDGKIEITNNNGSDTDRQIDERLENKEFIRYAMSKLPKARDIKRYLMTKDKTTGDRILERLWLEYEQQKTGKANPNSTGNKYFDDLIEEYRAKSRLGEAMAWDKVNWGDKLPCYDLWLKKAQNCRCDYTFIDDNSLGYNRNLRAVFFRWYEQYYSKQQETTHPVNEFAQNLVNSFTQMFGGNSTYQLT